MKLTQHYENSGGKVILQRQNGAAAVELAILLPFLAVLVFGIIEVGLLLYNQQVITNASREGARAAIVGHCPGAVGIIRKTDAEIAQIVTDYCIDPDDTTKKRLITFNATNNPPSTTVAPSPSDCTPGHEVLGVWTGGSGLTVGDDVTVTTTYNYKFLAPSLLGFGPTKLLRARTVMKMESAP
ncbi:MAG: tadE-like family protein [Nitrospirae bacterium]|nr:tadE-like family protein [Nitrospirota bacterium]